MAEVMSGENLTVIVLESAEAQALAQLLAACDDPALAELREAFCA